jgi:hypothetical protein
MDCHWLHRLEFSIQYCEVTALGSAVLVGLRGERGNHTIAGFSFLPLILVFLPIHFSAAAFGLGMRRIWQEEHGKWTWRQRRLVRR